MSDTLKARRQKRISRLAAAQPQPPQRTPGDIVAATFANLDLRATKAALENYYQLFTRMEAENKMLKEDLEQHEEDSLKVVTHLEEKLGHSMKETVFFRGEVDRIIAANKESSTLLMDRCEELLKERDKQLSDYASITERLQSDLRQASRYVQQRQEHAMELKHLYDQLEEVGAKHEKELTALRFQTLDRKIKLVALEKTMRQGYKDMVEEESNRLLNLQHRTLLERNRELEEEKVDMAHDIEDLMHLANTFTAERTTMRRRAELHRRAHEEVLRHTVTSNRESREKELKVQQLEAKVRQLLVEQRQRKEEMESRYSARIAELEHELKEASSSLQIHRLELKRVRELASTVVQQRTDLENFFYVALQDCQRYRQQLNGNHGGSARSHHREDYSARPVPIAIGRGNDFSESDFSGTDSFSIQPPLHADAISRESNMSSTGRGTLSSSSSGRMTRLPPVVGRVPETSTTFMTEPTNVTTIQVPQPEVKPPEAGLYVDELPWEDKEKIIKSLLFYINSTYFSK